MPTWDQYAGLLAIFPVVRGDNFAIRNLRLLMIMLMFLRSLNSGAVNIYPLELSANKRRSKSNGIGCSFVVVALVSRFVGGMSWETALRSSRHRC